ncbi:Hsp20/alpha crystallin family protein [Mariniphaga sp.]|uniref:Hsp20/alpha crystallin family protein n=1 Tax=Mariniphaga sp. TaxID=1954475 RepID=UPI0035636411
MARLTNSMFPSIPSFTDRFFGGNLMDWNNWNFAGIDSTLPAVNVKESDSDFKIEVAAPGLKKSDFKLNYDKGRLTISSEKSDEKSEKNGKEVTRREFSYQSFQRSFTIPDDIVNADKISAKYKDGILHVTLPKREEAKVKTVKEIKVS